MEANLVQPVIAALVSSAISIRAYRKKSLNLSGALIGFVVMSIHIAVNYRLGSDVASFLLHVVEAHEGYKVLSNSGCCYPSGHICLEAVGIKKTNTWSSELGILSDAQPRLITTLKPVRRGTNGGVTKEGLLAASAAGCVIGLTFVLLGFFTTGCTYDVALKQLLVIPLAALAGLGGSAIDSLLGATLQFSGFCSVRNKVVGKPGPTVKKISGLGILDNNAVNLVSILLTTLLTSIACLYIF
ncbi:integral membrane protein [Actinidia rufa]|uniref:Integral membrane protein n=1 Tax=Actinidia rufa TaxID=165716 RepID=A0A7J0FJF7_9ERIC|nr:integral membrane protein [Actinidia rufa]